MKMRPIGTAIIFPYIADDSDAAVMGWERDDAEIPGMAPRNAVKQYRRGTRRALLCRDGDAYLLVEFEVVLERPPAWTRDTLSIPVVAMDKPY